MSPTLLSAALATVLFASAAVRAETHTITFSNQCGYGTPQLILNGQVVSTGQPYTTDGAIVGGIAYLQTGDCGYNGEQCTLMEMTLGNPTTPGSGSSTDISLIAPHAFNVQSSFAYYDGCNGTGANCDSATCPTAFFQPNDNEVQVACQTDNVNLLIAFCADATTLDPSSLGSSSEPSSSLSTSPSPSSNSSSGSGSGSGSSPSPSPVVIVNVGAGPNANLPPSPPGAGGSPGAPPSSSSNSALVGPPTPAKCRPRPSPSSSSLSFTPPSPVPPSPVPPSPVPPSPVPPSPSPATPSPAAGTCPTNNERRSTHVQREPAPFPENLRAVYDARRRHHLRSNQRRTSTL